MATETASLDARPARLSFAIYRSRGRGLRKTIRCINSLAHMQALFLRLHVTLVIAHDFW